ncbi:uncharacterized protein FOMMEDRAFT_150734 [Fomitiporia mediterranea MF3/22]|uniref:uncharacterized protein n=1 Tax=Fomitiporia mediterranea (strain MF3/22) TaxID=694068 RepID=UPI000440994F|nr:uncharacterized protein FOMMEDRAFT_150734 [Fomitiporia mediterranea MF3/22]EJD08062.1 hypothetical protein FOMMEDRAFT_150734 [Fomitiporia mediterranea MF3/22]
MSINSLPVETLGDIFHECVQNRVPRWAKTRALVLVRISSVCQRWREVSLSHGILWTYLDYTFHGSLRKQLVEIIDAWLHRSNGAPLNFSFRCELNNASPKDHEAAERIVLMLISHQWHWGKVRFIWQFRTSPSFPVIRLTNMPKLTSLDLYVYLDNNLYRDGSIDLSRSPRLEYLHLNYPFPLNAGNKPMHLPAVDTIDLDYSSISPTVPHFLDVLEATPNLRIFLASSCTADESSDYEGRPIVSHNLRTLAVRNGNASLVLKKLDLPALEVFICRDGKVDNAGNNLSSFVERSLPPLIHLRIGGNCANEATVTQILPLLPLLQVLDMDPCTVSARLFRLLCVPGDAGRRSRAHDMHNHIVCPDLRDFYFFNYSVVGEVRECANAFCEMLESRWDALKMWDGLVGLGKLEYPISAVDCRRVHSLFRDAKSSGTRSAWNPGSHLNLGYL